MLAALLDNLGVKDAAFEPIMRSYLQRELLNDQMAQLAQGGYADANAVPLSNVFVDLPIESKTIDPSSDFDEDFSPARRDHSTFLEHLFSEASQVLRPSFRRDSRVTVRGASHQVGRIVLIGGPGQGKTTAGQFACQLMRSELLRRTGRSFDRSVEGAINGILSGSRSLPKLAVARYPVRIDLKHLAEAISKRTSAGVGEGRTDFSLISYLADKFSGAADQQVPIGDLRRWLRGYPWLLVLDGLDEVPASSNREAMMRVINDFIRIEAHEQDADLLVLATTRPQGYSNEFDANNYAHLHLRPLNSSEALEYGRRLIHARFPSATDKQLELVGKLEAATASSAVAKLMESPLQVTIMLALVEGGGTPPEQRWQLFSEYYRTIYRREKERGTRFSPFLRSYESDIHWIHHRAGWELQCRNAAAGRTAMRFTHDGFESLVRERLIFQGHAPGDELDELVATLLLAATDRLVLLVGNTAREIGFEIRSLQEFMAAEHCFDRDDETVRQTLLKIASSSYWRNVFLFVAGRIYFDKPFLGDSIIAICESLNDPLNDPAHGTIKSGSLLALSLLEDDASRNQPLNTRALARQAARLLDSPLLVSQRLSEHFQGLAKPALEQELEQRLGNGKFSYGAWSTCLMRAISGDENARARFREHYPWQADGGALFLGFDPSVASDYYAALLGHHLRYIDPYQLRGNHLEYLSGWISDGVLRGLEAVLLRSDVRIDVVNESGEVTGDKLGRTTEDLRGSFLKTGLAGQDLSDGHPHWRVMCAAAEFLARPGKEELMKALARSWDIHALAPLDSLPWQMNCAFSARKAGISLDEIESRLNAGDIGDIDDWRRWERRLQLKWSEYAFPSGVFTASDGKLGALAENHSWSHVPRPPEQNMKSVTDAAQALKCLNPNTLSTQALIQLVCFGLSRQSFLLNRDHFEVVSGFIETAIDLRLPLSREIVIALIQAPFSEDQKIALLSKVGSQVGELYWLVDWSDDISTIDAVVKVLYESAFGGVFEEGFLCAISVLPPLPFLQDLSRDSRRRLLKRGGAAAVAAKLISFKSLSWESLESERIADFVRTELPWRTLEEWVEYTESSGSAGSHLEELVRLLIERPSADMDGRRIAVLGELLQKLLDRRPAPVSLPDPAGNGYALH